MGDLFIKERKSDINYINNLAIRLKIVYNFFFIIYEDWKFLKFICIFSLKFYEECLVKVGYGYKLIKNMNKWNFFSWINIFYN